MSCWILHLCILLLRRRGLRRPASTSLLGTLPIRTGTEAATAAAAATTAPSETAIGTPPAGRGGGVTRGGSEGLNAAATGSAGTARNGDGDRRRRDARRSSTLSRSSTWGPTSPRGEPSSGPRTSSASFSFDWEDAEDTSRRDTGAHALHQSPLLFGRGFLAGVDRREQKKTTAEHEREARAELLRRRMACGVEDGLVEKRWKAAAAEADAYDDAIDMPVDRHWSEKALEEMTERDWRIFREDFDISYKGALACPGRCGAGARASLGMSCSMLLRTPDTGNQSPIQMAAIPLGLSQRGVIGVAETGSGKTAAFVLPMLCCA